MFGIDAIGLGNPHFDINALLQAVPKNFAIGFFGDKTFGPTDQKFNQLIQAGYTTFRVHPFWSYAHAPASMDQVKNASLHYEAIAKANPGIKIYLSYGCESKIPDLNQSIARVGVLQTFAPSCTPVSCLMKSPHPPGCIIEQHGEVNGNPGDIVSYDGASCFDADNDKLNKLNADSAINFFWAPRCNLAQVWSSSHPDPGAANRTAAPGVQYLKAMVAITQDKGVPPIPTFQGHVRAFLPDEIYKTAAEDISGSNDNRANKPVLITHQKAQVVQIVTFDGKPVEKLAYYAPESSVLNRFYSGYGSGGNLWGFQIAEKALALSGSPYVWFTGDGKNFIGPVHGAFRANKFL